MEQSHSILDGLFGWSRLARIGRLKTLKTSYLWLIIVPLIARLLSKLGPEITIEAWQVKYTFVLGLPFSWIIFYFSSVAFAIASFFFSLRCPGIIRDYRDYSEFRKQGKGGREITLAFRAAVSRLPRGLKPEVAKQNIAEYLELFSETGTGSKPVVVRNANPWEVNIIPDRVPAAFWYVRDLTDQSFATSRSIVGLMYFIGFAFVSVLLIQNFVFVWKLAF